MLPDTSTIYSTKNCYGITFTAFRLKSVMYPVKMYLMDPYGTVGDVKAQLLRSIPITHRLNFKGDSLQTIQDYASRYFNDLQYKKLLRNNFHGIQIEIRDVSGENVSFASLGIVKLTLHFRRVNSKDVVN